MDGNKFPGFGAFVFKSDVQKFSVSLTLHEVASYWESQAGCRSPAAVRLKKLKLYLYTPVYIFNEMFQGPGIDLLFIFTHETGEKSNSLVVLSYCVIYILHSIFRSFFTLKSKIFSLLLKPRGNKDPKLQRLGSVGFIGSTSCYRATVKMCMKPVLMCTRRKKSTHINTDLWAYRYAPLLAPLPMKSPPAKHSHFVILWVSTNSWDGVCWITDSTLIMTTSEVILGGAWTVEVTYRWVKLVNAFHRTVRIGQFDCVEW